MGRSVVSTEATETGTRRETGSCRPKWSPIPTTADTWIPVSEPRGKLSSGHLSGVGFGWYLARISLHIRHILSLLVTANACVHVTAYVAVRRSLSTTYTAIVLGLLLRQYVSYQFGVWAAIWYSLTSWIPTSFGATIMEHESIFVLGLLFDPPGRSVICLWRVNQWLYRWQKKTRIASHAPLFSRIETLHIYVMERMHAKSHHIKSTNSSCVWFPPFPIVVGRTTIIK